MKIKPFIGNISFGHRVMYIAPAILMGKTRSSIIDVGCGDGYGYHTLVTNDSVSTYFGIDSNPVAIQNGVGYLVDPAHSMVCGDWLTHPEKDLKPADFVFCIEVIEHVPVGLRKAFVEKCKKFMKRNLFLSTPPADRCSHGKLTIPECSALIKSAGLDVVVVDIQWTTLYICSGVVP